MPGVIPPAARNSGESGHDGPMARFASYDGTQIGYRVLGAGPPLGWLSGLVRERSGIGLPWIAFEAGGVVLRCRCIWSHSKSATTTATTMTAMSVLCGQICCMPFL